MAITPLPQPPVSTDKTNFNARADAFLSALPAFVSEVDQVIAAFTFNATNSTSSTSVAIGLGTKNFTVTAGKSYVQGMAVKMARTSDATKWMYGEVLSYNSSTGALSVDVRDKSVVGGTFADWTISLASTLYAVPKLDRVVVHSPTGYGSTNTRIPIFSTVMHNDGDAITYATSAANGDSFTLNEKGLYLCYFHGFFTGTSQVLGASLNSARLTTNISSLVFDPGERIMVSVPAAAAATPAACFGFVYSAAGGDVVRPHTGGNTWQSPANQSMFGIIKVF